jgi:hypothetical protein
MRLPAVMDLIPEALNLRRRGAGVEIQDVIQ